MKMMGKIKNFVFGESEIEGYEETYEEIEEVEESSEDEIETIIKPKSPKVVSIHSNSSAKIMITKPVSYDEAGEIADAMKNKKIVVANTNGVDAKTAQRLVDFLSGACRVLGTDIQEIEHRVYLLSPSNVEVTNELKSEISSKSAGFIWNGNKKD